MCGHAVMRPLRIKKSKLFYIYCSSIVYEQYCVNELIKKTSVRDLNYLKQPISDLMISLLVFGSLKFIVS